MSNREIVLTALAWSAVALVACDSQGTVAAPADAAADHSVVAEAGPDATEEAAAPDAAPDAAAEAGEASAAPPARLLLSYNGGSQSEVVAFGLQSHAVDGRLTFDDWLGGAYVGTTAPWVLEESTDIVGKLDGEQPWVIDSSWNVAMNDLTDAGYAQPYSDPDAVIVGAGPKAYVFRYTRNLVAVLDTSKIVDGGQPSGSIDLSGEVQSAGDGYVQPVAAVYVAATQRVYAVLGNIDRNDVVNDGYNLLCTSSTPTVIAIDTTTDTLVDLNGTAPGNGWPLVGYNPILGPGALAFDPLTGPSGRLLVLDAGCNLTDSDGGAGALAKREVESIDLSTGQATQLLDLTAAAYPSSLTYIDAHHAIVQLDTAYAWDPATTTLGAAIPNAPDAFAYDGQGHLLGVTTQYGTDGGLSGYAVLSVSVADGGVTQLGANPFVLTNGYVGGAALWPSP